MTCRIVGAAAPILGYGALNALLYVTYNRSLKLLDPSIFDPTKLAGVDLSKIWLAGALGGLASWVVSAPSELIKCRTQLCVGGQTSSFSVAKTVLKNDGLKGLYLGGVVTSLRDSIGYGFYFWSYELTKRLLLSRQHDPFLDASASDVLVSGGVAGVITWASIYPLDVVKTRLQAQEAGVAQANESRPLLESSPRRGAMQIAKEIFRTEGPLALYRGLGICSARAFIVNAVQVSICPSTRQFLGWLTFHSGILMRRPWLSSLRLLLRPFYDELPQAPHRRTLHQA
jgi:solute carrier family 25 carnitine/acylcarnitine transporter 20/29